MGFSFIILSILGFDQNVYTACNPPSKNTNGVINNLVIAVATNRSIVPPSSPVASYLIVKYNIEKSEIKWPVDGVY